MQPGGVEPPTYRSVVCRSIQLSYGCTRRLPSCGRRIVEQPAVRCKPLSLFFLVSKEAGRAERDALQAFGNARKAFGST